MAGEKDNGVEDWGDITVGIVDDNKMFASLLERELNRTPGIRCVGRADSPDASRQMVTEHKPAILLMDIFLPGRDGIALAAELLKINEPMRIVVFTNMSLQDSEELQLMAASRRTADAWDFVSKTEDSDALVEAIRSVALGHRRLYLEEAVLYLEEAVEQAVRGHSTNEPLRRPRLRKPSLSSTESYVLQLLGQGLTSEEIRATRRDWADKEHAVESHIRNLRNKFGVSNQVQLILEAQRLGFLKQPEGSG